jgi:hypothetical protein
VEAFDVLGGGDEVPEELWEVDVHGSKKERGEGREGAFEGELGSRDMVGGRAEERIWVCWED